MEPKAGAHELEPPYVLMRATGRGVDGVIYSFRLPAEKVVAMVDSARANVLNK